MPGTPAHPFPGASPLLVVLSAPSGGGKSTLCQNVLQARPAVERAITCTTRPPRAGEQNGVDYHFLSAVEFASQVAGGAFLEHATVHGHRYGTRKHEVSERLARGHDVLLNIDVQGAALVRAQAGTDGRLNQALVTVFLTPPSFAELEKRLRGRGTDAEEVVQKRLAVARHEAAQWRTFDYIILSQTPAEDLSRMLAILEAEKLRQERWVARLGEQALIP